jgi:predicted transcriptional regulator
VTAREVLPMALGSLESQVMAVLWEASRPLTVREVLDALNSGRSSEFAYTTVLTVLQRLAGKGALARSERGRGHAYAPTVADEAGLAVADVLRTYGDAAVADPELRERLRRLAEGGT